jgi:hypothetical protein
MATVRGRYSARTTLSRNLRGGGRQEAGEEAKMKNFLISFSLTGLLAFGAASYAATPGEAPTTVACNEGSAGALDGTDRSVLTKTDTQDDGNDHYELLALSAWASAGNSTYCMRWELQNQSPKNPPNATGTAPALKNVAWSDVDLYKESLEPGGLDKRAVKWTKRDYSSTPIDQNTDVTGATDATFKLKAFLPRIQQASSKSSDTLKIEKVVLSENSKFSDIITGYSEGNDSVLVVSRAAVDKEKMTFAISVSAPHGEGFQSTKFPFASAVAKADSAKGFAFPQTFGALELPVAYQASIPLGELNEKSFYIVDQPLLVYNKSGYACILTPVYSPIPQSFEQKSCR